MKLTSKEDIAAPVADVFRLYSDFDHFERIALRRDVDIVRTDNLRAAGKGMAWKAAFKFRGRARRASAEIVEYSVNNGYAIDVDFPNLIGVFSVEMVPLSKNRTRVAIALDVKPKSLTGRLMIQSMKLGKARIDKRFKTRSAEFAKSSETKLQKGEGA